jgi:hypothetical protein
MFHDCGEQLPSITYGRPSVDQVQLDAGIGVVPVFADSNMRNSWWAAKTWLVHKRECAKRYVSVYSTIGLLADEDGIDQ